MTENTKKANSLKENILDALLAKDTSTMTVKELDEYAKAVSSAAMISAETISDMFEKFSNYKPISPINVDNTTNNKVKPHAIECLKDTADLMASDDWKDRLKAEYWQLDFRLKSLNKHIKEIEKNLSFETLPKYELLKEQSSHMKNYLDVLFERCSNENVPLFDHCYCCLCSPELVEKYSEGEKDA